MKLAPRTFRIFMDVHTWAGVIASLLLYVMFFAGGFALFLHQLELWGEPFAQRPAVLAAPAVERAADALLAKVGPKVEQIQLTLPRGPYGVINAGYRDPTLSRWASMWIDPDTGTMQRERERLAHFLYSVHFLSHKLAPGLDTVAGLVAVALLLALVTGVLVQLKNVVRQFHQFRPKRRLRIVWSDMHKVLGIMGLPFQLVFAFTGAFIVLGPLIAVVFAAAIFDGDRDRVARLLHGGKFPDHRAARQGAPSLPLADLIARAREAVPHLEPQSFVLRHRGDAQATVDVRGRVADAFYGSGWVRLRSRSGEILASESPRHAAAPGTVRRWIYGLHMAGYGDTWLRVLYALLAAGTCLTILTGNWIWLARREAHRARPGNRLLARLTVGVGAGLPVATAALFVASRVLPFDLPHRGAVEEGVFLTTLAAMLCWALVARDSTALWWKMSALAGALFIVVPLLSARVSSAGLFGASAQRISAVVAVTWCLLSLARCSARLRGDYGPRRSSHTEVDVLETSSLLAAYASFALLHAADTRRLPRRLRLASWSWWPSATRLAAVVAFATAVALWGCSGDWIAAPLVAFTALMASASIFVLLSPIMPRLIWGIALCAPIVVPVLALFGGALAF